MKTLSRSFIESILSYGIIAGLLIIVARIAVYLLDVDQTNVSYALLNFVYNLIVLSYCLYFGTISYRRKTVTGMLTYGKGLLSCIAISFIAVFLISIYDILFHSIIAPDYFANMIEPQIMAISNSPSIPLAQKMELLAKMEKYTSPFYNVGINALMSLGLSVIISLIIAIFTVRRKRPLVIENKEDAN